MLWLIVSIWMVIGWWTVSAYSSYCDLIAGYEDKREPIDMPVFVKTVEVIVGLIGVMSGIVGLCTYFLLARKDKERYSLMSASLLPINSNWLWIFNPINQQTPRQRRRSEKVFWTAASKHS